MSSLTLMLASLPFFVSMGFSPGPNNILVASSGVNYGFRATIPHILGITVGFPVMLLLVGLGMSGVFTAIPWIHVALKIVSIVYLAYLALRIATATAAESDRGGSKPFTFLQAAAFQWVNVKAWIISVSAVATFTVVSASLPLPLQICTLAALAFCVTLVSVSCWTLLGHSLRGILRSRSRRWFNYAMAALLLASIVPTLLD